MSEARGERLRASFADEDRERRWPNQRPRDAATLILVDGRGRAPKVLMGRRHEGLKFMPGKFVFPGGRIDPSDRLMGSASELRPEVAARLAVRTFGPARSRARALALTAIRETYEETGLMLGRPADAPPAGRVQEAWQAFYERGVEPDLARVAFLGRAITPPRRPRRFDTRFFVLDRSAIAHEQGGFVGPDKELVELAWVDLAQARALDLPRITSIMLEELEHRLATGLADDVPVPFYREERGHFRRDLL